MEELRVTKDMTCDLGECHEVKEALQGFFLSGKRKNNNSDKCGICLGGGGRMQLGKEAVGVVLQSLLVPPKMEENVKKLPQLWLCEECGSSLTALADLFLQLEELRTQFNDLRRIIGRQVILESLGRSQDELKKWEEEVKGVEHIFPSLLLEEEEGGTKEDMKLKNMSPVVLLERMKATGNLAEADLAEETFWFEEDSFLKVEAAEVEANKNSSCDDLLGESFISSEGSSEDDTHAESFMEVSLRLLRNRKQGSAESADSAPLPTKKKPPKRRRVNLTEPEVIKEGLSTEDKINRAAGEDSSTAEGARPIERIPTSSHSEIPCTHCDLTFDDPSTFKQHKLWRHFLGSTASGDPQCLLCLKFFPDKSSLEDHHNATHPEGRVQSKNRKVLFKGRSPQNIHCFVCTTAQSFHTPEELKAHEESPQHKQKISSKSSAHCNVCRLNFGGDLIAFQVHLKSFEHTKEVDSLAFFDTKTTYCVPCRRNFGGPRHLLAHTTSHLHKQSCKFREIEAPSSEEVSLKCPSCCQFFDDQGSLDRHVLRQHGPKGHKCKFCKKLFAHRKEMIFHRRSHKNEISRNVFCDKCGKAFEGKKGLRNHIQFVHEGGPSDCEICGRTFARPPLLRYHVRYAHSGVYSSDCPHCAASFKVPQELRKHLFKVHPEETLKDNPHPCIVCFHVFPSERDLEEHLKVHAHLKCSICGSQSPSPTHLNAHLRREHPSSPLTLTKPDCTLE